MINTQQLLIWTGLVLMCLGVVAFPAASTKGSSGSSVLLSATFAAVFLIGAGMVVSAT